ncbi:MAG: PG0541 family transporter-associated protein [Candidatus Eisenbacteria bacterium]
MEPEIVLVIYNSSIEDEVMEALTKAGMTQYTKFTNLRGVGELSEPRLNTQIWPGTNSMLLICVPRGHAQNILEGVRRLKEIHEQEGVRAFVLPVTEIL